MADTASLIARVKTEGAETSAKQLDDFATSATRADKASDALGKTTSAQAPKLKGFGTGAQQIGFQVQDMVVQLQAGTSAFVALGQQGSQLAGAFGPGGAVLGAVIALASAVGGVLYKSLGDARLSSAELQAAQDTLQKALKQTSTGSYEVADSLTALALSGGSAAEISAVVDSAHQALQKTLKDSAQATQEATEATTTWMNGSAIGAQRSLELGQNVSSLSGFLDNLSSSFGITNEEARKLTPLLAAVQREATPDNVKALAAATDELVKTHGNENAELVKLNGTLQQHATATRNAEAAQKALDAAAANATKRIKEQNDAIIKNVQIGNLSDKKRYAAQAEADKEAFAKRQGVTEDQIKEFNKARDEQARQDIKRVEDTESKKAAAEQRAAENKSAAEAKRATTQAAQQKQQAQNFLDTIDRQNQDEIKAIDAQEQQKLDKLAEFRQNDAITQQQYEDAKTQIILDADTARQEELDKRKEEQQKREQKGDDFMAQIMGQNASELELFNIQQKQKEEIAKQYREQGIINEDQYQASLLAIAGSYNKKRRNEYANILGQTTDDLKNALGEGNKAYKAFAIANAIMQTYVGATAAFQSAAAIPIVGWIAAPIAAAAAIAAGLANVSKIRSAREQGGNLAAGQMSTIAERGKPEVIMPAGASRVRTADQMRQIMGENSGKSGGDSVTIVNNTTGRIDSATTERDNEGRLRVIISETVSSALQDSNSDISKSRRSTRNQPGFA